TRDPAEQVAQRAAPSAAAPTAPTASLRVRPETAFAGPPAPAQPGTPAPVTGGLRRIDRAGQSPLFTNVPDAAVGGNESLLARGQVSAQNMAAADALAGSQQRDSAARVQTTQPSGG
ncbi:hypothetical protein DBR23_06640, partial [Acidovorax sp. HMWF018]